MGVDKNHSLARVDLGSIACARRRKWPVPAALTAPSGQVEGQGTQIVGIGLLQDDDCAGTAIQASVLQVLWMVRAPEGKDTAGAWMPTFLPAKDYRIDGLGPQELI